MGSCYPRDTSEFSRFANLSDAVFAIAMTLLVLNLSVPEAADGDVAGALLDQLPQLMAFVLSFALVANLWLHHHRFVEMLGSFETGLVVINLALMGAVALVPYPTSLIGSMPNEMETVFLFISLFIFISLLFLLFTLRAESTKSWRVPVSRPHFLFMVTSWVMSITVLLLAMAVAYFMPIGALAIMAAVMLLGPLTAKSAYKRFLSSLGGD